ncbi:MAG: hypothetical protein K9J79_10090 [Desulfobacteraceae bacterium]|nr:hypothetical protein [Desulfobacteraceae bacterium]MCF8095695.1 hypothetical protein [Desulfobacteraceae bacterium]
MSTSLSDAGRKISHSVSAETNDPKHEWLQLRVSGRMKPYITVEPRRVSLRGRTGEEISQTVRIIREAGEPFSISKVSAVRGVDVKYELEEIKDSGKKGYALHIKNTRQRPGRYHDSIHVETDSERIGRITIAVSGIIQPAGK